MKAKTIEHPEFGQVLLIKRRGVRRISIRISDTRGIRVTMPWYVPFAVGELFLRNSEYRVTEIIKERRYHTAFRTPVSLPEDPIAFMQLKKEATITLSSRTRELALQHGFTAPDGSPLYKKITLKNNKSNWGSCSAKGNINLNIRLHLLPEHLRDYVILHELCHLRHMNHGPEFKKLLSSLCPRTELKRELVKYTIA